jgi:mRNA interferase MazF
MEPLRGEVWDVRLPRVGEHPAVVLSVNALNARLSSVAVAVVTRTEGPAPTHVAVGREAGLTRYDTSYVNATDLHAVDKARLRTRRGLLHPAELARVESAVRLYLGL